MPCSAGIPRVGEAPIYSVRTALVSEPTSLVKPALLSTWRSFHQDGTETGEHNSGQWTVKHLQGLSGTKLIYWKMSPLKEMLFWIKSVCLENILNASCHSCSSYLLPSQLQQEVSNNYLSYSRASWEITPCLAKLCCKKPSPQKATQTMVLQHTKWCYMRCVFQFIICRERALALV